MGEDRRFRSVIGIERKQRSACVPRHGQRMDIPMRFVLRILSPLVLLLSAQLCHGIPSILIDSGKPKCVSIDAPQDTIIRITYEAPDLITDVHDANFGPTFLTVSVKPSNRILDTDLHSAPVRQRLKPLSHPVETKEGVVTHQFEVDGTADVCVRATKATAAHPLTFAWRIESSDEVPAILVQDTVRKMNAAATPTTTAAVLDEHLTHMERELQRITTAMSHVLKEADHNKDQDALFHQQTIAMHSATTFWPIVQVCVLLMTGFTQASHIVRFFKSRRII